MNSMWTNINKEELVIISEIITGGSLKKYLLRLRQPRLKLIKQWCRGILSGLDYLHSQRQPIVHGDLTLDSIYIMAGDGTVKVSDSYLNKIVPSNSTVMGSPEYIAPEAFLGDSSPMSDIYSFGMALLEMCTQKPPYQEHHSLAKVYNSIRAGTLPQSLFTIQDPEIVQIIKSCLASKQLRPNARELLSNPIMEVNENPKNLLPILISLQVPGKVLVADTQKVHISLVVTYKNHSPKDISFDYCMLTDSPESVAKEMVENFQLDQSLTIKIAEEIEKKLEVCVNQNEQKRSLKIFKFQPDMMEPKTALPVIDSPFPCKLRGSNSYDEITEQVSLNDTVKTIQQLLNKIFDMKLNCDGFNGKKTMLFIKKFQHQEGLIPNGIASEELVKLLTHRISNNN